MGEPGESEAAVRLFLNGEMVTEGEAPVTLTLLDWLRANGQCGVKEGCAEGDCGACTVAVQRPAPAGSEAPLDTRALNACIMPLAMAHGANIVTVEGLCRDGPHPVQAQMVEKHASQCGFCTPGFVMSLYCRPRGEPVTRQVLEDRLAGNLCRCTGYGPILDAAAASAEAADACRDLDAERALAAALGEIGPLDMEWAGKRIVAPRDEGALRDALSNHPNARIIAGATDVGLWITKDLYDTDVAIFIGMIGGLSEIQEESEGLRVGAAVTHQDFLAAIKDRSPSVAEMMRRFGGPQVRASGTVGGNIANGSPIGDLPPALIAAGATLEIAGGSGKRTFPLEDFFIDYGKQDLAPGQYVRAVTVPLSGLERLTCHKLSKRFDSDISAVLLAVALDIEDGVARDVRIACGGMAATPRRAFGAEAALRGRTFDRAAVAAAQDALREDFSPISDMRASASYRMKAAQNLLMREFLERTEPGIATRLAGASPLAA